MLVAVQSNFRDTVNTTFNNFSGDTTKVLHLSPRVIAPSSYTNKHAGILLMHRTYQHICKQSYVPHVRIKFFLTTFIRNHQSSTFIHESTLLGSPDFYSNWEKPEPIYMYPLVISSGEKGIEQAPVGEFPLDPKTLISCLILLFDLYFGSRGINQSRFAIRGRTLVQPPPPNLGLYRNSVMENEKQIGVLL